MHCHQDGVGDALGAFALEVMLGHPEAVVAEPVHQLGHRFCLAKGAGEMGVRKAPLIDWRAAITEVVEVGVAGKKAVELADHERSPDVAPSARDFGFKDLLESS